MINKILRKTERSCMKKILGLSSLLFLLLLVCFPICKANFDLQPRELFVTMNDEFIQGNTSKSVRIINPNDENINISWYIDHPTLDLIRENRTKIPSLSWISLEPQWQIIPPKSNAIFYIYLDIPKQQKNLNQHWEIWPVFKQEESQFFNWEHTVRLYIDTPNKLPDYNNQNILTAIMENMVIIGIITIICVAVIIALFVIRSRIQKNRKS